jgi:hypothetical protein
MQKAMLALNRSEAGTCWHHGPIVTRWGQTRMPLVQILTERESPMTATRTLLNGSHKVITVSAATARTDPSPLNDAAVMDVPLV